MVRFERELGGVEDYFLLIWESCKFDDRGEISKLKLKVEENTKSCELLPEYRTRDCHLLEDC